ncbi:hypothetical protein FJZ31_39795 [Candidatus Poribacteria bacterium]|nr:hypothetical protein [Candidatus Poribacteria bacterium]
MHIRKVIPKIGNLLFFPYFLLLVILLFIELPKDSYAGRLDLEGNMSLWWDIYEENENGIMQPRTREPAADVASGFNLKQGRISLNYEDEQRLLGARFHIRLEEQVSILDGYGIWRPFHFFHLYLGQMKVPSTYEALTADTDLDFSSRSTLAQNLTDWSLSRSPYYSALYGNRSYNRDLGIGIRGKFGIASNPSLASYFLMTGNGLGANLFISGKESKEFIFSNNLGDYFYGVRLDVSPLKWLFLGGHYSLNKHDNMLFNDGKTVFDLDRYSWSIDSRLDFRRVRFVAMYGAGKVDDNYFYTDQEDLKYSGYEAKFLVWLIDNLLQLGVRYDTYTHKYLESGISTDQNNLTFGVNFMPMSGMCIQLNYVFKKTENKIEPDLDDNILFLNFQYSFKGNI